MFTLFRRIRQKLVDSGSITKYLLYAIGEILLVMIGILLALQVNNWNEDRKLRNQEVEILESLKASLAIDMNYQNMSSERNENTIRAINHVIDHIEADLPYEDSLKYHFSAMNSDWGLLFDYSTYETLKANNINLISDDSLRNYIIDYYSFAEGGGTGGPDRYTNILEEASRNIYSKHFDQMWSTRMVNDTIIEGQMIPSDYEALKRDREFMYFLKTLRNQNYWLIERNLDNAEQRLNELIPKLNSEIARLSGN